MLTFADLYHRVLREFGVSVRSFGRRPFRREDVWAECNSDKKQKTSRYWHILFRHAVKRHI